MLATRNNLKPTKLNGVERTFKESEIIVSKTDPKGIITYANDIFLKVSGYTEKEILGKPHNYIRHPDMPHCVFKLLWDTIKSGKEIFAYVINTAKNGDYYWVLAHVTPSFDAKGNIIGYHSNRRSPRKEAVKKIEEIYAALRAEEEKHSTTKAGTDAAFKMLVDLLTSKNISYDEFVLSL